MKPKLRREAHYYFDQIWKNSSLTRKEAYEWLAGVLGVNIRSVHFSNMRSNQIITNLKIQMVALILFLKKKQNMNFLIQMVMVLKIE